MSIYHTISRICIVLLHGEGQKRPARADASRMQDVCTYREMAPAPPGPTPAKGSLLSNTGYTQRQLSVLVYSTVMYNKLIIVSFGQLAKGRNI